MNPRLELVAVLQDRHPALTTDQANRIVQQIVRPVAVLRHLNHIVVQHFGKGEAADVDNQTFTDLASRDHAEVRVAMQKNGVTVYLGPTWWEGDSESERDSQWDGRCSSLTCVFESSVYFSEDELDYYIDEARNHLNERH